MSTTIHPELEQLPREPSQHDGLAIAGFITAFFVPLIGFILGCVSISTAHRENRKASGLAVAAAWIGGLLTVLIVIIIAVAVHAASQSSDQLQQYLNCINSQLDNPNLVCTPPPGM